MGDPESARVLDKRFHVILVTNVQVPGELRGRSTTRQGANRLHAGIFLIRWQEHAQGLFDRGESSGKLRGRHGFGVDADTRASSFDRPARKHLGKSAGGDDFFEEGYRRAHVRMAKPRARNIVLNECPARPDT